MAQTGTMELEKGKLLFLEDKKCIVDDFHKFIKKEGYDFLSTSDAEEALLVAEFEKPGAILIDMTVYFPENSETMPEYDFLEKLKKNPKIKNIPVVILADSDSEDERKKCERMGAAAYITRRGKTPGGIFRFIEAVINKSGQI